MPLPIAASTRHSSNAAMNGLSRSAIPPRCFGGYPLVIAQTFLRLGQSSCFCALTAQPLTPLAFKNAFQHHDHPLNSGDVAPFSVRRCPWIRTSTIRRKRRPLVDGQHPLIAGFDPIRLAPSRPVWTGHFSSRQPQSHRNQPLRPHKNRRALQDNCIFRAFASFLMFHTDIDNLS